jgi:ATP synthase F1 delta subunit
MAVMSRTLVVVAAAVGALNLASQAFVGSRPASIVSAPGASKVAMKADLSGLIPSGPLIAYMKALMDQGAKSGESVAITKDVMRYKRIMEGEMMGTKELEEFYYKKNSLPELGTEDPTKQVAIADLEIQYFGPWESTIFPKFIKFLAKKTRLAQLGAICQEYMSNLYVMQSIAPVVVVSAQKLSEEHAAAIKEKMKARIGVNDIKLVTRVDSNLIAGFKIMWGFTDPELLDAGSEMLDYTFKAAVEKSALDATR